MPRDILVLGFPITRHKELIKTNKHLNIQLLGHIKTRSVKKKRRQKSAFYVLFLQNIFWFEYFGATIKIDSELF